MQWSDYPHQESKMKTICWLLFFTSIFACIRGDSKDINLNDLFHDSELLHNEAAARGRLVDEDLKVSKNIVDKSVPEMENLHFLMKGMLDRSLDLRRQLVLVKKYQANLDAFILQITLLHKESEGVVKRVCEQIDDWKVKGRKEDARRQILDSSRNLLQASTARIEKMLNIHAKAQKELVNLSNMNSQVEDFLNKAEGSVERANSLAGPMEQARRILLSQQKESSIILLRLKTLEILHNRSQAIAKKESVEEASLESQAADEKLVGAIRSNYIAIKDSSDRTAALNKEIEDGITRFNKDASSFKDLATQILGPFQSGLQASLNQSAREAEAMLVSAVSMEEEALSDVNKLRLCISQIEEEVDLVFVPSIKDMGQEEAMQILLKAKVKGLKKSGEPAPKKTLSGKIYEQIPEAGQKVLPDSVIIFRAYEKYNPIVPDLTNKTVEEAEAELSKSGLAGAYRLGVPARKVEDEGKIYSQQPRAYSSTQEGTTIQFSYYDKSLVKDSDEFFSKTPFFVLCRLFVPRLKPNAPKKKELKIENVTFEERPQPFVIAVEDEAIGYYPLSFFETSKAVSSTIRITGKELASGKNSQYDGALLLEVVQVYHTLEQLKQKLKGLIDLSEQDPLAYIKLTQHNGMFNGVSSNEEVQLRWTGGPLQTGWPSQMKESSFSLFRQLL